MEKNQKNIFRKLWKVTWVTLVTLLLFVLVSVSALYVPVIQDYVVPRVLALISSEDMSVSVDEFRLKFPLDVNVSGLEVMQRGDTMLMAGNAHVRVSMLPLIIGRVESNGIELSDVYFKSGTPDSVSYIRAKVSSAELREASVGLGKQLVDVKKLMLGGGTIKIALRNDTTAPSPSSSPVGWCINSQAIALSEIDFEMTMPETGDSISACLDKFTLKNGAINLGESSVNIDDIVIDGVEGRFITGGVAPADESLQMPVDTIQSEAAQLDSIKSASLPMSIRVNHLLLDNGKVLYATSGVSPQPGLDMQYIDVQGIKVEVDSFYNCGASMRVPLRQLEASERSGLRLSGKGLFSMTPETIEVHDFNLRTLASMFKVDAVYGATSTESPLSVMVKAEVDPIDVKMAMPSLEETIAMLPMHRKLVVDVNAAGSLSELSIYGTGVSMRNYFAVELSGVVNDIFDFDRASGHLVIDGDFEDINFIKPTLMDAKLGNSTHLPPLNIGGSVDMSGGVIDGKIQAFTQDGNLALDGKWNSRVEGYEVNFVTDKFPVGTFLPGSGVGAVTVNVTAHGRGLDPMNRRTEMYAAVDAVNVGYRGYSIHDLKVEANLGGGNADLSLNSANGVIDGSLNAAGNLAGDTYEWDMAGDFRKVDLYALGVMDTASQVALNIAGKLKMASAYRDIDALVEVRKVDARLGKMRVAADNLNIDFTGTDSLVLAQVDNHDLRINFVSPMSIDSVGTRFANALGLIEPMVEKRYIDVVGLQQSLPLFELDVDAGTNNVVYDYLADGGTSFHHVSLRASNDDLVRITASVDTLISGKTRFDRIDFNATQEDNLLNYDVKVDNKPGTFDDFAHVEGFGFIGGDQVKLAMQQRNIKNETGYRLGALVELSDSTLKLKLEPVNPIIGYKKWHVNDDNFVSLNTRTYHVDANLRMENNESRLHVYTEHDSLQAGSHQEKINVDIDSIQISEWLSLNPYAPPMKGFLSAEMQLSKLENSLSGAGVVTLADFMYAKKRVGTLGVDLDITTSNSGAIVAKTRMAVDGKEVMKANGALNDTTQLYPFNLDFALTRLPLNIVNPFIGGAATLNGYLSGDMDVTGSMSSPKFNGYLDFDSATARVAMAGTTFRFSDDKIPVDSNVIRFNRYSIYGVNNNPLEISGVVDMRSLSNVVLDLGLKADNMQVVGNDKRRGSDLYGKAYISLDASARGNMRHIKARADLVLKEGTNVTYVVPDATSQIASQSTGEMVKFVNFADTATVAGVDSLPPSSGTMMSLAAMLTIEPGAVVGVNLSANGQDRVEIESNGSLDFSLNPLGDTGTTGRLNITGGYVRYSPPLMSQKKFDFKDGSYVAFNGDIGNPALNVTAVDVVKANVTQDGQNSRLVNFDVILRASGTLSRMDVAFDLDTYEDLTVRNELQSMSPEQRANQAMNLLLYNMYTGPGTKGNANITGNPLYSFLSSQLNTWMANNVKAVDISFGIDQYERTRDGASSTTTSYSYKVSKSFLDDRVKVVVGGNYTTDADANENLSQNLINDISIEYLINKSGTMYVRLFRHTGFESILEGEVTQTGVGFVYKRKLRTLRNLFGTDAPSAPALTQDDAVKMAGDVLRMFNSKSQQSESEGNEEVDRQPINVKEDEQ